MYLREHMEQMCKAVDVAAFESNSKKANAVLVKNPDHLEYLCEFHYRPKLFALYKIN